MNEVGKSTNRVDALAKVTGKAKYPGDFNFADQLVMKVLFSERAHARVLDIDTSAAEALEGVVLVLTARDVPVNEYGLIFSDQPVLCGPGSDKEGGDIVRFEGDHVALVIAESKEIAEKNSLNSSRYSFIQMIASSSSSINNILFFIKFTPFEYNFEFYTI